MNAILTEIDFDIQDVASTNFVYTETNFVPNRDDSGLSYERGKDKRGKEIETCVLFVDIRDSVALTDKHKHQTMGKVYTAFTKAVLKVAKYHGGHIRNIIGDRVMVVFPVENCFKNSVECAISINHIASKIIKKRFNVDFKCGIGIAYGKLRVIKVGIQRRGTEHSENKGLVWVGKPANYASRITDMAYKSIEEEILQIRLNPRNPRSIKSKIYPAGGFFGNMYDPSAPLYLDRIETREITKEEFSSNIFTYNSGDIGYLGGRLLEKTQLKKTYDFPPILITESVFSGLKKKNQYHSTITNNYWKSQPQKFKNMPERVFGTSLTWKV
jgi:class 3 adenylate cyclase